MTVILRMTPLKCPLSDEASKRLKWMYIIHFECNKNITKTSRRIGVLRQWLSKIHSAWIESEKNPRSLEPESKAPKNTEKVLRPSLWVINFKDKVPAFRS